MNLLTKEQMLEVIKRKNFMGFFLLTHCWLCIGVSVYVAAVSSSTLITVIAMVIVGSRQQALLVLMHEASHGNLFKNRFLNKFCSQVFCAYPVLSHMPMYKKYHAKHHSWVQTERDPDLLLSKNYPVSRKSMLRKLARDISGITGLNQLRDRFVGLLNNPDAPILYRVKSLWRDMGWGLSINLGFCLMFSIFDLVWIYFYLWLVPLLTWHQVVLRIRNIAEHGMLMAGTENIFSQARTTIASSIERFFIAPYWVNYHLEHHLFPAVPCYNLPQLRIFLIENGFQKHMTTEKSYLAVLKKFSGKSENEPTDKKNKRLVGSFSKGYKVKN